jgi:hypothetical protein
VQFSIFQYLQDIISAIGVVGVVITIIAWITSSRSSKVLHQNLKDANEKLNTLQIEKELEKDRIRKIDDANREILDESIKQSQALNFSSLKLASFEIGDAPWKNYMERAIIVAVVSGKGGGG